MLDRAARLARLGTRLVSALAGLLMFWAIRLWWKDERLPGRWVLFLLVIVG